MEDSGAPDYYAGEYIYYSYRPRESIICDAVPEDELKGWRCSSPQPRLRGTVHEAFFDPVAIRHSGGSDGPTVC